jgi:selenocysteine-specific elongation factor
MGAGASGIDIACLVVAADEGVMPQTREHLEIMAILGMKSGVVALTKADLVEPDVLALAHEEITELLSGTFLEDGAVVPVSAKTGAGLPELLRAIDRCVEQTAERPRGEVFRMFVDRIFTVAGFGTVVTGSVLGGSVRKEDTVHLLPGDKELRVRRLEHHGREVETVSAGDRASMNLVGLDRRDFERGMVVADRRLRTTMLVDARLRFFDHTRPAGLWSQGLFLLGTYEAQARVHGIDRDAIRPGETALVQIHLPSPCVIQVGDRFVLRSTSNDLTLGGGEVIDAAPLHHRRRPTELVERLQRIAEGKLPELVAAEVRKRVRPVGEESVAVDMNVSPDEVAAVVDAGMPGDIMVLQTERGRYLTTKSAYERLAAGAVKAIEAYHRRNPLDEGGSTVEELVGKLNLTPDSTGHEVLRTILRRLEEAGAVKRVGHTRALASHDVTISAELAEKIEVVEGYLRGSGLQTPLASELAAVARQNGIEEREMKRILRYLAGSRRVYEIEGSYLHASVVDPLRDRLVAALEKRPAGMRVAHFRDLIGGNRKICLLLYALFDREGITEREGDVRVLTDEGKRRAREKARSYGADR